MTFLKIAWRNIFRNYRRSLITLLAIATGIAGLLFVQAYLGGSNSEMIDNSTGFFSGHLQVHKAGFLDDPVLSKRIKNPETIFKDLRQSPDVAGFTQRVEAQGLLSSGEQTMGAAVIGIDPANEKGVTTLYKTVTEGRYLEPGDSKKILLGVKAAEKLKLKIGDSLVILTQAADGSVGADKFDLAGIFKTGMDDLDGYTALVPIGDAQGLYFIGSGITGFAVKLKDRNRLPDVTAGLKKLESQGYEIHPWQKLLPAVVSAVNLHEMFINFILVVVFGVVAIGIMNTISMSVIERTREFGVMMALGATENQILRIVLYESMFLGILGLLAGSLLGFGIAGYYEVKGINLSAFSQGIQIMPGLSAITYPEMKLSHFLLTGSWILVITAAVSLYPAWRAKGLEPVKAIRGIASTQALGIHSFWEKIGTIFIPTRAIFLQMAWRNLTRNVTRSLITLSAIGVGLASMIFFYATIEGFYNQLIENTTRYMVGDLQLAKEGFQKNPSAGETVQDWDRMKTILAGEKEVRAFSPRVETEALLNTAEKSMNIFLIGIDPDGERATSGLQEVVKEGRYLTPQDRNGILLGSKIAEKLKVAVGDKVVVMAQDAGGALSSDAFRVQGIIKTGIESLDGILVVVNLGSAQSLLAIQGVSTVLISVRDRGKVDDVALSLNSRIQGGGNYASTWKELSPLIVQLLDLVKISMNIFLWVVFGIVLLAVMNTILMSVMERTREFGMMMALGTTRLQVIRLVLLELLLLGLLGVLAGDLLGLIIVSAVHETGFDLAFFSPGVTLEKLPGMKTVIYPIFSANAILYPSAMIFVLSLFIGLYPAWRAASLDPARSLRHV